MSNYDDEGFSSYPHQFQPTHLPTQRRSTRFSPTRSYEQERTINNDILGDEELDNYRQFHSSTPLGSSQDLHSHVTNSVSRQSSSRSYLAQELKQLKEEYSKIALENEELKCELSEVRKENEQLNAENQGLFEANQEKEEIQKKMRVYLDAVTKTVYVLSEKLRAIKKRHYEQQGNAFLNGVGEK